MSIDLNWETLTGGPDGLALAEQIRDFIHTKFQAVPLPRFIKSVTVHEFEFGTVPPQVVLKDICDPLPDFYEENPAADEIDDDDDEQGADLEEGGPTAGAGGAAATPAEENVPEAIRAAERRRRAEQGRRLEAAAHQMTMTTPTNIPPHIHTAGLRSAPGTPDLASPFMGLGVPATTTPGGAVPGGTANVQHYFPSHFAPGWSGTQTPSLSAAVRVAGGVQHLNGWLESSSSPSPGKAVGRGRGLEPGGERHDRNPSSQSPSSSTRSVGDVSSSLTAAAHSAAGAMLATPAQPLREKHSVSTLAPTSAGGASRPPTRDNKAAGAGLGGAGLLGTSGPGASPLAGSVIDAEYSDDGESEGKDGEDDDDDDDANKYREPRVEDLQAVFRIKYAGDVKLMLTAEILLDYPMPSFVGIPVKLNITGLSFDGVGVVAHIRRRVHFCFLSPEDALAAVGNLDDDDDDEGEGDASSGGANNNKAAAAGGGNNTNNKRQRAGSGAIVRKGGLLQEIRVESEIGLREGSKQSLKNVGKVEKFVLEQVRRIFEEEFVYPSFWTFLV